MATICAHARRRAAFTAAVIRASGRLPPPAISLSARQQVGTEAARPNSSRWPAITLKSLITSAPSAIPHARSASTPAPVMDQQPPRGQRLGQARRQPRPIGQRPQQNQARVRHDALAATSDFQAPRPPGNVHPTGAPRSGLNKDLDTLIVPGQEHFLLSTRRVSHNSP